MIRPLALNLAHDLKGGTEAKRVEKGYRDPVHVAQREKFDTNRFVELVGLWQTCWNRWLRLLLASTYRATITERKRYGLVTASGHPYRSRKRPVSRMSKVRMKFRHHLRESQHMNTRAVLLHAL